MVDFKVSCGIASGLKCILCERHIQPGMKVVVVEGQAELVFKMKKSFHYEAHTSCAGSRALEVLDAVKQAAS